MALVFGIPRPESRLVVDNGTISREWFLFFNYLLQTVGGPSVAPGGGIAPIENQMQFEEYAVSVPEATEALRAVDELRNELASSRSELQSLRTLIEDQISVQTEIRPINDMRNRMDEVEAMVGGLPATPASYVVSVNGKQGSAFLAVADISGAAPLDNPIFTGVATSPKFQSATASVSAPTGVATTVYTLPSAAPSVYLVSANIGAVSDAANYSAFAVVVADGPTARIALSNNSALQTITLVGLAVKTTQSSGATQTANLTITKIG